MPGGRSTGTGTTSGSSRCGSRSGRPARPRSCRCGSTRGTIVDLFEGDRSGVNVDHVCLVVETVDLDEVAASGEFDVVAGPSELFGARGIGTGLYVRDPDGNVIELRHYG